MQPSRLARDCVCADRSGTKFRKGVDHPVVLANFEHHRVGGDERAQ